jgi:F0F1-type ATP synthase assembly protein I
VPLYLPELTRCLQRYIQEAKGQDEEIPMATNSDRSSWIIGGTTLVGIGVGMLFVQTSPFVFIASVLIGIGAGLVITPIVSSK